MSFLVSNLTIDSDLNCDDDARVKSRLNEITVEADYNPWHRSHIHF